MGGHVPDKNSHGFTLVELAIVLVIIGLVVGGIMVGQDLVSSAKQRKLLSELNEAGSAANGFRLKFGCVPGDCTAAQVTAYGAAFGGYACPAAWAIQGNGFIEQGGSAPASCISGYNCNCETGAFASNLSGSGMFQNELISLSGGGGFRYVFRSNAFPNGTIVPINFYYSLGISDHWFLVQGGDYTNSFVPPGSNGSAKVLSANVSHELDDKIDDGNPLIGRVRMFSYYGLGVWQSGWPEYGACATTNNPATSQYAQDGDTTQDGKKGCKLAFRSSF